MIREKLEGLPVNITIASIYYPPRLGGIENHVYYLSRGLAKRGLTVSVVTSHSEPDSPTRESEDRLTVRRTWLPSRDTLGWLVNAIVSGPAALREARQADLLHAHTFQSIIPLLPARLTYRQPLVVTIHSSHFLRLVETARWRKVFKFLLASADLILAPSAELARACRRVAPRARIEQIVNGIDTELFRPVEPAPLRRPARSLLVATRRLVPKNGVMFLVEAMKTIVGHMPCDLALVGAGPELDNLQRMVSRFALDDSVRFLGGIDNRDLPPILCAADAVVVPSLVEATSLSALEAMSCERPVAASRVGGLPEIIDDSCGVLFRSGDPADLAEKLIGLLEQSQRERQRLGAEGRRRVVANWSVDALVDLHLKFYGELLERSRG